MQGYGIAKPSVLTNLETQNESATRTKSSR